MSKASSTTNEITCPHCGKAFTIDEAGYADIVAQIRDREFNDALHERLALAQKEHAQAVELAKLEVLREHDQQSSQQAAELEKLKSQVAQVTAQKDAELVALKSELNAAAQTRSRSVARAFRPPFWLRAEL